MATALLTRGLAWLLSKYVVLRPGALAVLFTAGTLFSDKRVYCGRHRARAVVGLTAPRPGSPQGLSAGRAGRQGR